MIYAILSAFALACLLQGFIIHVQNRELDRLSDELFETGCVISPIDAEWGAEDYEE